MHAGVEDMPVDSMIGALGQYGLSGLVIGILFFLIFTFLKELKIINNSHDERHEKRNELHAAERREWLSVSKETLVILSTLSAQFEARK